MVLVGVILVIAIWIIGAITTLFFVIRTFLDAKDIYEYLADNPHLNDTFIFEKKSSLPIYKIQKFVSSYKDQKDLNFNALVGDFKNSRKLTVRWILLMIIISSMIIAAIEFYIAK